MRDKPRIAIVGAGISGLATAWYLRQALPHAQVTVFEKNAQPGGKIVTKTLATPAGPVRIEGGPDAVLTTKPWALELIDALDLRHELIPTNPIHKTLYVWRAGKLHAMPAGMALIVPTNLSALWQSSLFYWYEKLRILAEYFIPARHDSHDESLQSFVTRRFGRAMLDIVGVPLMASIYNADPATMSMQATFPNYDTLEHQYGSLIRAFQKAPPTPRAQSPFLSLRGGMQQLVTTLATHLQPMLRLDTAVHGIEPQANGWHVLTTDTNETYDAVVLTTPAHVSAPLLSIHAPTLAQLLFQQHTISTGTVSLVVPAHAIPSHIDGFGVVIPRSQGRRFSAMTISSIKFTHRCPDDYAVVRLFFGRSSLLTANDADIIAAAQAEVRSLLGTEFMLYDAGVFRWPDGNPQYAVGHRDWLHAVHAHTPAGLYLLGCSFDGVGIPDCIKQARQTAHTIAQTVAKESHHAYSTL